MNTHYTDYYIRLYSTTTATAVGTDYDYDYDSDYYYYYYYYYYTGFCFTCLFFLRSLQIRPSPPEGLSKPSLYGLLV